MKKRWIEFWCACAIIGCVSGFLYTGDVIKDLLTVISSALALAIIRGIIEFFLQLKNK